MNASWSSGRCPLCRGSNVWLCARCCTLWLRHHRPLRRNLSAVECAIAELHHAAEQRSRLTSLAEALKQRVAALRADVAKRKAQLSHRRLELDRGRTRVAARSQRQAQLRKSLDLRRDQLRTHRFPCSPAKALHNAEEYLQGLEGLHLYQELAMMGAKVQAERRKICAGLLECLPIKEFGHGSSDLSLALLDSDRVSDAQCHVVSAVTQLLAGLSSYLDMCLPFPVVWPERGKELDEPDGSQRTSLTGVQLLTGPPQPRQVVCRRPQNPANGDVFSFDSWQELRAALRLLRRDFEVLIESSGEAPLDRGSSMAQLILQCLRSQNFGCLLRPVAEIFSATCTREDEWMIVDEASQMYDLGST
mmetsp:Transcript_23955/g.58142  ORF Transcript_23955/g.58142 Transcript_23955/m.58142 type:complete len:361 (-) Transcript_23955:38-1120(-)